MPPRPESDPNPELTPSLAAGLAAFKQADYPMAIRILAAALPTATDPSLIPRAQMALVMAYARSHQLEQATDYCYTLLDSPDASLRNWAGQTLAKLTQRQASSAAPEIAPLPEAPTPQDLSGFVPLDQLPPVGPAPVDLGDLRGGDTLANGHGIDALVPESLNGATGGVTGDATGSAASLPTPATSLPGRSSGPDIALPQTPSIGPSGPEDLDQVSVYQPIWRRTDRSEAGQSLGAVKSQRLLWVQAGTLAALIGLFYGIYMAPAYFMVALSRVPILSVRSDVPQPPAMLPLLALFLLLWLASRWVLDALLTVTEGLQPLALSKLSSYSPEAGQSLSRWCRKRRIPAPALGVLPTATPVIMSYGPLPRLARIVVSQGVLEQLSEDEIAALYAYEVGQIANGTLPLMSLIMVLLQLPYTLYRAVADWGNRQVSSLLRACAGLAIVITYSGYWILHWFGVWLSRQRVYYSDRMATELTGNPSGVIRGLLKLAIGMAQTIEDRQQTPYLLESFDLLLPIGPRMALTLGSLYPHMPLEPVLEWERHHPLRHWLSLPNSHPPTGDRLHLLTLYTQHWQLIPQLNWPSPTRANRATALSGLQWRCLLLQGAPYVGLVAGFLVGLGLNFLGWVGMKTSILWLSWFYRDFVTVFGLMLVGFGTGTLLRINQFFPDIPSRTGPEEARQFANWLQLPDRIPITPQPLKLEGILLGRPDLANAVNQDLVLQTSVGLIRLHCTSIFSPLSTLLSQPPHPANLGNSPVTVTGWFRRGATPWIDVETIRTVGGRVNYSYHPIWSTIAAALTILWGIYVILRGNPL